MPLYYFDTVNDDGYTTDDVGVDLPDDAAARRAAIEALLGIAGEEVSPDGDQHSVKVVVRDPAGQPIYSAELTLEGKWLK